MDILEKRAAQIAVYGTDIAIYQLSMVALLDEYHIDPKYAHHIRLAIDGWWDTQDREDFCTGKLRRRLLEIDPSDNMKAMCERIASHAYHMEEAFYGSL